MRLAILVGSLLVMTALGGCAEGYPQWDPQMNGTYGQGSQVNATDSAAGSPANATANATAKPAPQPRPAPQPSYPVPMVPATLPGPIALAESEGDGATLRLEAGPEGLACVSIPTWDPDAAPRGYKLLETWTECSLSAVGQAFAEAAASTWDITLPLVPEIPVDNFTWTMTVGRIVENNTGAREQIVVETEELLWAAPSLGLDVSPAWPQACATWLSWDRLETVVLTATAENGRAVLEADLREYHLVDWASDQNVTENNGTFHVVGDWGGQSVAQLEATLAFEPRDPHYLTIGWLDCPTATSVELQEIPFTARAEGIAAGWHEAGEGVVEVEVYSNQI